MSDLADRLAIQDVMTRYAAGVDDRDMAQYRACFADDVEIVGFGGDPVQGADLWVEDVIQKLSVFGATQHMLGPQLVKLAGDQANAQTFAESQTDGRSADMNSSGEAQEFRRMIERSIRPYLRQALDLPNRGGWV